ncbi:hypothetical protein SCHPADRAFT_936157 [Schizopora paradoxa]|uniref:Uncharacterized protein n=1 Tax=Schizopora paradoxa TaxID=27342 RepID=A0A0H2S9X1_9AGAM|nr:hypothetical protein SCHPADRAFT_936157 [Schizopora paradoxa]
MRRDVGDGRMEEDFCLGKCGFGIGAGRWALEIADERMDRKTESLRHSDSELRVFVSRSVIPNTSISQIRFRRLYAPDLHSANLGRWIPTSPSKIFRKAAGWMGERRLEMRKPMLRFLSSLEVKTTASSLSLSHLPIPIEHPIDLLVRRLTERTEMRLSSEFANFRAVSKGIGFGVDY